MTEADSPVGYVPEQSPGSTLMTFEEFREAHAASLAGLARVLCGNQQDAIDLLQDTLLEVWERKSGGFDMETEFPKAYARTIMTHKFYDGRRSAYVRHNRLVPPSEIPEPQSSYETDAYRSVNDGAELRWALLRIPRKWRTILALRHYIDLSTEEIAEAIGTTAGSVLKMEQRAKRRLRRILNSEVEL